MGRCGVQVGESVLLEEPRLVPGVQLRAFVALAVLPFEPEAFGGLTLWAALPINEPRDPVSDWKSPPIGRDQISSPNGTVTDRSSLEAQCVSRQRVNQELGQPAMHGR